MKLLGKRQRADGTSQQAMLESQAEDGTGEAAEDLPPRQG